MAGLDPEEARERTCGELTEYIRAWRERQKLHAMLLYNQAAAIASFVLSSHKPRPQDVFPGLFETQDMSADELVDALDAWDTCLRAQEAAGSK